LITGHWHSGFVVADLERSIRFYTDGLGLSLIRSYRTDSPLAAQVLGYEAVDVKVALIQISEGAVLELLQYIEPHTLARQISERHVIGSAHLALTVDDITAALDRLVEFGGTRKNDPAETEPGLILTYAQDPDGNWLEFAQIDRAKTDLY
jgi:lactoylglutathione lyase